MPRRDYGFDFNPDIYGPWDAEYQFDDGQYFFNGQGNVYDPVGAWYNVGQGLGFAYRQSYAGENWDQDVGYGGRLDDRYPFNGPVGQDQIDRRYRTLLPDLSNGWPDGPIDYRSATANASRDYCSALEQGELEMYGLPPQDREPYIRPTRGGHTPRPMYDDPAVYQMYGMHNLGQWGNMGSRNWVAWDGRLEPTDWDYVVDMSRQQYPPTWQDEVDRLDFSGVDWTDPYWGRW